MFEYVMSGVAHARVTYESCYGSKETLAKVNEALKLYQGKFNHYHSFLYNGYTEKKIGSDFNIYYKDSLYAIHADSGGLQVVTRGEDITPELKRAVYEHQAKYCDIAMSFDEIPLTVQRDDGYETSITDIDNRFFDYSKFKECAELSADNLEEQIDYFQEVESDTKPLLIAHGNNIDDFCAWVDIILERIPEHKHKYIAGLSLAGTALGAGMAEIVERLFSFSAIRAPEHMKKNLHLLGVGSITRMAPAAGFVLSGLFKDVHISYDSTTHSASVTRGTRVQKDGTVLQYGRDNHYLLEIFRHEVLNYFPGYIDDCDPAMFRDILQSSRTDIFDRHNNSDEIKYWYHLVYFLAVQNSVLNAVSYIDKLSTSQREFNKFCCTKKMTYLIEMLKIKDRQDFDRWYPEAKKRMKSQRVQPLGQKATLGHFVDEALTKQKADPTPRPAPNSVKPKPANIREFFDEG